MKNLKSKIITLALAICLVIPSMFLLTACKEEHKHDLTKVDASTATCTTAGNTEYYECDCGKYFSDEEAKTEIEENSWIIPATGHSYASTWTYNETHHWKEATCSHETEKGEYAEHSLTNNECACGYVAIVYTVADGNAWNEVFTGDYLNNGTITITSNYYENDVLVPENSGVMVMKSTENAMVMEMGDESQYLVKSEGEWYALAEFNNAWYGMLMDEEFVTENSFAGGQGIIFVDKFSSFEYDATNKCYIAEDFEVDAENGLIADYFKVYIENGKLIKMEMSVPSEGNARGDSEYIFSNYGTTVIDIPSWTIYEA